MYKIENTINDIRLQHPEQIAPRFFVNDETVKISGIILNKPYKLQITAVAKVKGTKKKRVRSIEYASTLKDAIADAVSKRLEWMKELKDEIKDSSDAVPNELKDKLESLRSSTKLEGLQIQVDNTTKALQSSSPDDLAKLALKLTNDIKKLEEERQKHKQEENELLMQIKVAEGSTDAITKMMTLNEAFERYVSAQIIKFQSKTPKREYDEYRYRGLYDKHIRKTLGNTLLDNIDAEDIQKIVNKMKVSRAKLDKNGNKIPLLDSDGNQMRYMVKKKRNGKVISGAHGKEMYVMETRPATERTKRSIYLLVNPIYNYVNNSNKVKYTVPSPATMVGLEPLSETRKVTETIKSFTKLYNYENSYYRNIFVWLMHGRRFGEVSSLEYQNIDLDEGTYTIRAENNKAKVDMTYKLTKWQKETLPTEKMPESGLVFSAITSSVKRINHGTVSSNHWNLNCTIHDLRHIIGSTLVSNGVSIEIIGRILGHKPQKNIITNRYSEVSAEAADDALCSMLEKVLVNV
ncbi:tyrosine-type recombinase/integrase [Sulfurimonas sp.]|nr:tyrosine-type recombinase/integrase [Sulfurimonas sp.]